MLWVYECRWNWEIDITELHTLQNIENVHFWAPFLTPDRIQYRTFIPKVRKIPGCQNLWGFRGSVYSNTYNSCDVGLMTYFWTLSNDVRIENFEKSAVEKETRNIPKIWTKKKKNIFDLTALLENSRIWVSWNVPQIFFKIYDLIK